LSEAVPSEAELVMKFEDEKLAELVLKSLSPDNEPLPTGLRIVAHRDGKAVVFKIYCKRPIKSLLATLDDIVSMAILALKAVRVIGAESS